ARPVTRTAASFNNQAGTLSELLGNPGADLDEGNALEARAQHLLRVGAQVRGEDLLVNGAEVDVVLEVAGGVELGQLGRGAVEPALDRGAEQQQRRGSAVVGSAGGVLLGPAAELGPGGQEDVVRLVVGVQVQEEG